MAAMSRNLLTIMIVMLVSTIQAQKIEVIDTSGNIYVGKKISEDSSRLCILSKHDNVECFEGSLDYARPYRAYNRAIPLTKANDPYIIAHDIGFVYRSRYPDAGLPYTMSIQKRFTDHVSAGMQGTFGMGGDLSFLDVSLRAIGTYQFNPADRYVHNISLNAGPLKDIAYDSKGGFDVNVSYTLLQRKQITKSRRLSFSTGFYSAEFLECANVECSTSAVERLNQLQLRLSYGWQF